MDALEQSGRRFDPYAPMTEQTAAEPQRRLAATRLDEKGQSEVGDDVIVVACIQSDTILSSRRNNAVHDIERAVAIERSDLDRNHVLDRGEAGPEAAREPD